MPGEILLQLKYLATDHQLQSFILTIYPFQNSSPIPSYIRKALECLAKTYQDTKDKKLEIKKLESLYKEASKNTADLLEVVSAKATVLEKTKALCTDASNSLSAFLQMNEVESEEEVEDELLIDGRICQKSLQISKF